MKSYELYNGAASLLADYDTAQDLKAGLLSLVASHGLAYVESLRLVSTEPELDLTTLDSRLRATATPQELAQDDSHLAREYRHRGAISRSVLLHAPSPIAAPGVITGPRLKEIARTWALQHAFSSSLEGLVGAAIVRLLKIEEAACLADALWLEEANTPEEYDAKFDTMLNLRHALSALGEMPSPSLEEIG